MTNIHEIDTAHPANSDPGTATTAEIEDALGGRKLFNRTLLMKFDGFCRRCRDKNRRRKLAGIGQTSERFEDGEHVRFVAYYVREDEAELAYAPPGYWRITKVICAEHPVVAFDDVAAAGRHQVRGHANIDIVEGEGYRLRNPTIENRSPADEGDETTVVDERREQFVTEDDDEHPDGVIVVPSDKPEPTWPEETREWLANLKDEHGPLTSSEPEIAGIAYDDVV